MIISIIGVLHSLITISSELNVKYTYSAPFTQHEVLVVLAGFVSLALLGIGISCIAIKESTSATIKSNR